MSMVRLFQNQHTRNVGKIIFSLFLVLLVLPLTRQGMFVDGVWYAAIAKNMSQGLGSIWDPALSKTLFLHFREHPPLAIAMQSIFFKLLGDGFWVERLYSFCLAMGQITLLIFLWHRDLNTKTLNQDRLRAILLLLLLWLLIPINIGMYKDNLLEGGLTLFATLACWQLIRTRAQNQPFYRKALLASGCLIAGFMCNGPTVLFPLIIPVRFGCYIEPTHMRSHLINNLILILICCMSFAAFFIFFPGALDNLKGYFQVQLMAAITGQRDLSFTGWKHFYIFYIYFKDYIWVSMAAVIIILMEAILSKQSFMKLLKGYIQDPWFRFYFVLSLFASLPVGISHRQMFHYISASAPIYLLAMLHFSFPAFSNLLRLLDQQQDSIIIKKLGRILSLTCVICLMVVLKNVGGYNKNQHLIEDVQRVSQYVPQSEIIKGSQQVMYDFDIPANFARYSFISFVDPNEKMNQAKAQYYIYYPDEPILEGYQPVALPLRSFKLAQLVDGSTS